MHTLAPLHKCLLVYETLCILNTGDNGTGNDCMDCKLHSISLVVYNQVWWSSIQLVACGHKILVAFVGQVRSIWKQCVVVVVGGVETRLSDVDRKGSVTGSGTYSKCTSV